MATITDTRRPGAKGAGGDDKKTDDGKDDGAKKGMSKLVLIIIGAVVMAAIAGAGYFFFIKDPAPAPPPAPGTMVQMDPMTLTLADQHFLKIQIAIQLNEGVTVPAEGGFETVQAAQLLIDTFSNLPMEELTKDQVRKDLTADLLTGLQKAYPEEVYGVFLTQFVIQ